MSARARRGFTLVLASLLLVLAAGALVWFELAARGSAARRDAISDRAIAQAREALIAYAADRPINAWVGPGYLPCPDLDDDGWAESTCGSQSGDSGQEARLGRLPWKTLGLPDLRDGHGERLWYAVSSKHKGLLNCGASRACVDMSPDAALGTITVRDPTGTLIHDGTSSDLYAIDRAGALAVVIAPGARIARLTPGAGLSTLEQRRDCASGECDAAGRCLLDPPMRVAKCHPANYLEKAPDGRHAGEDNADFVDRNDAAGRARNTNGFIQGPVYAADGSIAVNDRVAAIGYRDVMPRVMRRVALEVAQCLASYASRPENAGRLPTPAPVCRQASADPAIAWADGDAVAFGRIPDTPFARTRAASGARMLERWWRHEARAPENLTELPTQDRACRIAYEPGDAGPVRTSVAGTPPDEGRTAGLAENAWWTYWKPFVFYTLAPGFRAGSAATQCDGAACVEIADAGGTVIASGKHFAVIVAGAPLVVGPLAQRHGDGIGDARQWLEDANAALERANPNPAAPECAPDPSRTPCDTASCLWVTQAAPGPRFNDAVVAYP
jgi:hypothetical protein